jgi:hypothetical protein
MNPNGSSGNPPHGTLELAIRPADSAIGWRVARWRQT